MPSARQWMDLAARHAVRGVGRVEPNPMVGAVVVRDGVVLGVGHHRAFGGPHAEREALASCVRQGNDPRGAEMYVTLEPCRHTGKQPPCTEAIVAAGISRVVFAATDPGRESGGGRHVLRSAGVPCERADVSPLATLLSAPFIKRSETRLPWVIAKWAQTIDGRVATRTGESKWISGEVSRRRVHRLRGMVDAILTGLGTVIADDPLLTARGVRPRRVARRVVVDTHLEISPTSRLVATASRWPTLVACAKEMAISEVVTDRRRELEAAGVEVIGVPTPLGGRVDLGRVLAALVERCDVSTVLVEAGPGLTGSLFAEDLVDQAVVYVAPLLLGDELAKSAAVGRAVASIGEGRHFDLTRVRRCGQDVELTYVRRRGPKSIQDPGDQKRSES